MQTRLPPLACHPERRKAIRLRIGLRSRRIWWLIVYPASRSPTHRFSNRDVIPSTPSAGGREGPTSAGATHAARGLKCSRQDGGFQLRYVAPKGAGFQRPFGTPEGGALIRTAGRHAGTQRQLAPSMQPADKNALSKRGKSKNPDSPKKEKRG